MASTSNTSSEILSYFSIRTGKHIQVKNIRTVKEKAYPHSWFESNNQKPELHIPPLNDAQLVTARRVVRGVVSGNNCKVEIVFSYLAHVAKKLTAVLEKDWKSYNLIIGNAREKISPCSILDVKEEGAISFDGTEMDAREADDKWLVMYLLSIYRLERASDVNYRAKLMTHIGGLIKAEGGPENLGLLQAITKCKNWVQDPGYRKMIAVYDMFFFKFPNHEWSNVRISTTGSRYRDCAALLSVSHTAELLGFRHHGELCLWMTAVGVDEKFEALTSMRDEYHDPFSFFPYQMDLGLTPKCAYSSRENPSIHTFCHLIGAYLGNVRSLNARWILGQDIDRVVFNAHIVGFAFTFRRKGIDFLKIRSEPDPAAQQRKWDVINRAAAAENQEELADIYNTSRLCLTEHEDGTVDITPPNSDDAADWKPYLDYYKWNMSPRMLAIAKDVARGLGECRPGTVGEFVKSAGFTFHQ